MFKHAQMENGNQDSLPSDYKNLTINTFAFYRCSSEVYTENQIQNKKPEYREPGLPYKLYVHSTLRLPENILEERRTEAKDRNSSKTKA